MRGLEERLWKRASVSTRRLSHNFQSTTIAPHSQRARLIAWARAYKAWLEDMSCLLTAQLRGPRLDDDYQGVLDFSSLDRRNW